MTITNSLFSRTNYKTTDLTVKTAAIACRNWENLPEIEKKAFFENLFISFAKEQITDTNWKDLDVSLSQIIAQEHTQATKTDQSAKKSELMLLMHEIQTLTERTLSQFPRKQEEPISPVFQDLEPIFLEVSGKSHVVCRGSLTGQVFSAMLEGGFLEKNERRVRLENFTNESDAFDVALRFLRGEKVADLISYQNIKELWHFSSMYDLKGLESECDWFFKQKFDGARWKLSKKEWEAGFEELLHFYLSMSDNLTVSNQEHAKMRQEQIVSWARRTIAGLSTEKALEFFTETIRPHVENGVTEFLFPVIRMILEKMMEAFNNWKLHLSNGKLFFVLPEFDLSFGTNAFSFPLLKLLRAFHDVQPQILSLISGYAVRLDKLIKNDKDPVINYSEYIQALERALGNIFFYEDLNKIQRSKNSKIIIFIDFASLTYEGKTEKEIEQMFKDNFENGFRHSSKHKERLEGLEIDFVNSKEFVEPSFGGLFDSPQVEL